MTWHDMTDGQKEGVRVCSVPLGFAVTHGSGACRIISLSWRRRMAPAPIPYHTFALLHVQRHPFILHLFKRLFQPLPTFISTFHLFNLLEARKTRSSRVLRDHAFCLWSVNRTYLDSNLWTIEFDNHYFVIRLEAYTYTHQRLKLTTFLPNLENFGISHLSLPASCHFSNIWPLPYTCDLVQWKGRFFKIGVVWVLEGAWWHWEWSWAERSGVTCLTITDSCVFEFIWLHFPASSILYPWPLALGYIQNMRRSPFLPCGCVGY